MDQSYPSSDNDEEAAAMAAAMGFASFGARKPAAKKRKFNSATDAFVEGDDLTSLDKGGKKGQGSGGNTMPLGKQRMFGAGKKDSDVAGKANEDEIALEDQDEDEAGPRYIDTSKPPPAEVQEEDGPQYMDTSQPAPIEDRYGDGDSAQYIDTSQPPPALSDDEAQEMQARIDAILAGIQPSDTEPSMTQGLPAVLNVSGIQARSQPHELPQRPPPAFSDTPLMQGGQRPTWSDTASVARGRDGGRGRGRHSGGGQRNERWYEGYYDPSFNENPWEKLETAKRLQPLGIGPENVRGERG